ncbi:MAG: 3'-5' exonuclease, partial [bacterium]
FSDDYASAIIVNIANLFNNYLISVPDLINFIEENMEHEDAYNISFSHTGDYVTIQTIHGAKGLEYPVVFIANVNQSCFPSFKTDNNVLFYHDLVGLRIKKEYGERNGYKYIFDKWQTDLLTTKLFSDYDEERRLLYVAITRAKQYLFFTANDKPSKFFENMKEKLPVFQEEKEIEIEYALAAGVNVDEDDNKQDDIIITSKKTGLVLSVHDLMQCKEYGIGKGKDFEKRLHNFAHKIALGFDDEWNDINAQRIRAFIKSLQAKELKPEIDCSLPVGDHLIRGVIDLLVIYDDKIEIIDYKSDTDDSNENEYRKQLSIYYHTVYQLHPGMKVTCKLYYVCLDVLKEIEPLSMEYINSLVNDLVNNYG